MDSSRSHTPHENPLGDEWLLDNFYLKFNSLHEKEAPQYRAEYSFDTNGDGTLDQDRELPLYDLRYKHRRHDASVWVRTAPMSTEWRERDLRVFAQAYVDEIAGAGYEAVRVQRNQAVVSERRYAAEFMDRSPAKLAAMDAYEVTINVANLDQVRLTPAERRIRVRLVFTRLPAPFQIFHQAWPRQRYLWC